MNQRSRLDKLLEMTSSGKADSFAFYALAMEYKSLGQDDKAIETFTELRARDPGYVPMYLICGTLAAGRGNRALARDWLEEGLAVAKAAQNRHTANEIESVLATLDD